MTIEHVDKVLIWWKISDNEYKIIFEDLTTENISTERLVELEKELVG